MIAHKVNDKYKSVHLADIRLQGKIARLMDTFFYERVMSAYAQKTIYQETADVMVSCAAHFVRYDEQGAEMDAFSTKVCDYASAGNMIQDDPEYFSIYF